MLTFFIIINFFVFVYHCIISLSLHYDCILQYELDEEKERDSDDSVEKNLRGGLSGGSVG